MRRHIGFRAFAIGVSAACLATIAAAAGEVPPLVAAYTAQLASQCGVTSGAAAPSPAMLSERLDLNGDRIEDWVVDAGRYACPARSQFADAGAQVTIFMGRADGLALPAFQRVGFGARLERPAGGGYRLWLTLGGADCDDAPAARCDRQVVWRAKEQRFELAGATPRPPRKSP